MELLALAFVILGFTIAVILTILKLNLATYIKTTYILALPLIWVSFTDLTLTDTKTYQSTTEKVIVSSAPSSSELSGSWIYD